jgi:hypothetical protein
MKEKDSSNLKQKVLHEVYLFLIYTLFLTLFLCTFTTYRLLILKEYGINYVHYGYNLVEAMIFAKIILLGQKFGIGERFSSYPLIVPTLYKAVSFSLFSLIFTFVERITMGYFEGKDPKVVFHNLTGRMDEILAGIMVMFFFFLLFFAFLEIGNYLGEKKLYNLFFKKR